MTHEEEFVEAISNLIEAYFLWYGEAVGPASDIGRSKTLGESRLRFLP